ETTISPGRAPAVSDDEATVGGVADDGDGMAATDRVGLESIEFAARRGGVIPGRVHAEPGKDRAVSGQPGTPVRQVLLQIEIGGDAPRRRRSEEGILVPQVQVS